MSTWTPLPHVTRDLDAVTEWCWSLIDLVDRDDVPLLGSLEWVAADPATRLASLARWALVQLDELNPDVIAARLAAEIAIGRREYLRVRKASSVAVSRAHDWRAQASRPSHAEIERRRLEPPRGGRG